MWMQSTFHAFQDWYGLPSELIGFFPQDPSFNFYLYMECKNYISRQVSIWKTCKEKRSKSRFWIPSPKIIIFRLQMNHRFVTWHIFLHVQYPKLVSFSLAFNHSVTTSNAMIKKVNFLSTFTTDFSFFFVKPLEKKPKKTEGLPVWLKELNLLSTPTSVEDVKNIGNFRYFSLTLVSLFSGKNRVCLHSLNT